MFGCGPGLAGVARSVMAEFAFRQGLARQAGHGAVERVRLCHVAVRVQAGKALSGVSWFRSGWVSHGRVWQATPGRVWSVESGFGRRGMAGCVLDGLGGAWQG